MYKRELVQKPTYINPAFDLNILAIQEIASSKETPYTNIDEISKEPLLNYLSRLIMRNPSSELRELLQGLKVNLRNMLLSMDDDELSWFVTFAKESRGFFAGRTVEELRENIEKWAETDIRDRALKNPSIEISAINSLLAAISYAAFANDDYSKTDKGKEAKDKLARLMRNSPYMGAYINERNKVIVRDQNGAEVRQREEPLSPTILNRQDSKGGGVIYLQKLLTILRLVAVRIENICEILLKKSQELGSIRLELMMY